MFHKGISTFRESLRMSWSNIRHNRMRTFLTMLGIIIGVMAIITLITVVQGATSEVTAQFTTLGTGRLTLNAQGTPLKRGLNATDLEALAVIDNVAGIAPSLNATLPIANTTKQIEDAAVEGRSALFFERDARLVARGRPLNPLDIEGKNYVCLIDSYLQRNLFFGEDPIGQQITINGMGFTIIGIMADTGSGDLMAQAMGRSRRNRAVIPYTSAMRLTGNALITSLEVYVEDPDRTSEVAAACERVLSAAFNNKENTYSIINMESLLETMNTMLDMMTGLLAGIASIALLVGGIGIMNMMLVSVSERRNEIGLRKALGAEPGQIQLQFLIESFLLSTLGGIIGISIGVSLSVLICRLLDVGFVFSSFAVILGFSFSVVVGIIFGWMPARKASTLNPIEALRSV